MLVIEMAMEVGNTRRFLFFFFNDATQMFLMDINSEQQWLRLRVTKNYRTIIQ